MAFGTSPPLLERPQKVQDMLLVDLILRIEVLNDPVGFGCTEASVALAGMRDDGLTEIARPAVVQGKNTLSHSPQRRCAKLIRSRTTLDHVIRKSRSHPVYQ